MAHPSAAISVKDRTRTVRVGLLLLVVGAHLLLALLWPATRLANTESASRSSTLVLLARPAAERKAEPLAPLKPPPPLQAHVPAQPERLPEPRGQSTPAPKIDWASAAQQAVADELAAQSARLREAQGFTGRSPVLPTSPETPSKPEFGWQRWRLHRVEALPQGGLVVHLNERCVLVISALLIPACGIGKIPARGDLFEHMHDAPEPGDWKN